MNMNPLIELRNMSFNYELTEALSCINLEIFKGDSVSLIGTNGSGKSTLLKVINGIYFPQKGEYLFDGKVINEKNLKDSLFSKSFHKRVGFVFQNSDVQLFCSNVYEEIAFGPRQMGMKESDVQSRVMDCLSLLHIEHLKHREPYHLSEGEKKKVAIASVLSLNPDVIILDEPMNNLDPRTKIFLRDFLIKLNLSGKTIIAATHEFEYVQGLFKKAIVLSERHEKLREDVYELVIQDNKFLKENNIK
jgi:cobalt/nickel transport system ATP-binding protein